MDYRLLKDQAAGLVENVDNWISNLANLAALLYQEMPQINWAGFYIRNENRLELGPFQGKPACAEIPVGKGVCGSAAAEKRILRVPDVTLFAGHIACDKASRSELVIPLCFEGEVIGVLDIDSPVLNRFSEEDEQGLAQIAQIAAEGYHR